MGEIYSEEGIAYSNTKPLPFEKVEYYYMYIPKKEIGKRTIYMLEPYQIYRLLNIWNRQNKSWKFWTEDQNV